MVRKCHHLVSSQGLPSCPIIGQPKNSTVRQRGTAMTPDTSRWRSSDSYNHLDNLNSPDLAWEWLRRNTDYQKDFAENPDPSLMRKLRRKWGLQFFRAAVAESWRSTDLLVRSCGYERGTAHRGARFFAGGRHPHISAPRHIWPCGRRGHTCPARSRHQCHPPHPPCRCPVQGTHRSASAA